MGNTQTAFEDIESQPLDIQLLHAAEYGDSDLLVKLLDGSKPNDSFDIDVTKHSLWTPLFMAAKQGHAGCVWLLLEAGTNQNFAPEKFSLHCNQVQAIGPSLNAFLPRRKADIFAFFCSIVLLFVTILPTTELWQNKHGIWNAIQPYWKVFFLLVV